MSIRHSLIGVLLATSLAGGAIAADTVGINAAIRNKVMSRAPSASALSPAKLKARVALGEQVVTARASMLQILLLDRSNFTVGSNARVTIDKFVYDPNRKASAVGASVAKGAFRFMSSKAVHARPGESAIRTPVASIGVRGTVFEGVVGEDAVRIALGEDALAKGGIDPATASLIVLRGPAPSAYGPGGAIDVTANGKTIAVDRPGMAVFVPGPGADPVGPFALSDKGLAAFDDLLRTAPDTRGRYAGFDAMGNPVVDRTLESLPDFNEIGLPIGVID